MHAIAVRSPGRRTRRQEACHRLPSRWQFEPRDFVATAAIVETEFDTIRVREKPKLCRAQSVRRAAAGPASRRARPLQVSVRSPVWRGRTSINLSPASSKNARGGGLAGCGTVTWQGASCDGALTADWPEPPSAHVGSSTLRYIPPQERQPVILARHRRAVEHAQRRRPPGCSGERRRKANTLWSPLCRRSTQNPRDRCHRVSTGFSR
jgi:hypothetical protein